MWIKLDDKFWRNSKMRKLSHAARGVFCDSLSYCGDVPVAELTGYLSRQEALDRATGNKRLVEEMVGVGCLEPVNGGYLIHDFPDYLPKTSRERTQAWREKKRGECHGDVTAASQDSHGDTDPSRARDGKPEPEPVPGVFIPPVVPLTNLAGTATNQELTRHVPGTVRETRYPLSMTDTDYGIPKVSMHPSGLHDASEILGTLKWQSVPRKEKTA